MKRALTVAFVIFVLDQIIKYLVVQVMDLKTVGAINLIDPFLNLRMAWNRGVNFGLGAGLDARWILVGVALVITCAVIWWVWKEPMGKWAQISAGLLIGGALGNVVDRVVYGAVADFLNMSCCGIENPFAFNVADISIFAGALGLVFLSPSNNDKKKKT
ncbi:signal peptidase II [Nereida sp. MMG025]|uniref:signal peptidase II n=1 Tax=Nereida sp. MMG025 TaxID=2909981 RepID=UPI001F009E5F|nr:signal peptidase II [Nereida sp. MMG025]MCF6444848.1 signal peptidase II [Nereida sp. MMG025]